MEDLFKKRDSYATDLEQFHDLIDQMDQHVAKLKQKKSDQSAELEETNKKLATVASKIEKLEVTIKEQEFSVEDVQKMETERKLLKVTETYRKLLKSYPKIPNVTESY